MITCYSYLRFSDQKQRKGDSLRRQLEWAPAVAEREGWTLDTSLRLQDLGVSAFRGKNAQTGALAGFLEAVRGKMVAAGHSVLLVEALDRLTREDLDPAWELIRSILKAGVAIRTREPEYHYKPEDLNDFGTRIMVQAFLLRGFNESQTKSMRVKAYWTRVRQNQERVGPQPLWIDNPAMIQAIQYIYQLASQGQGVQGITRALNHATGIAPPPGCPYWSASYVALLLRDRRLLGERQPCVRVGSKRVPVGPVVLNAFPVVIPEALWYTVRGNMQGRDKFQRGREGKNVANLFTGLLFDARDSNRMHLISSPALSIPDPRILVSSRARDGATPRLPFPYLPVEDLFLRTLRELTPADLTIADATAPLQGRLTELDGWISKVQGKLDQQGPTEELLETLARYSQQRKAVALELEQLRAATIGSATLHDSQSLAVHARGGDRELRWALKSKIRFLVDSIWMLVANLEGHDRVARLQVFFRSGLERNLIVIWHRYRPKEVAISSYYGGDVPSMADLRRYREDPSAGHWLPFPVPPEPTAARPRRKRKI